MTDELVYPRERVLGGITLVLGLIVWLGLIAGTFGIALVVLALGFLFYLFVQSALIAHIKGNGVELSPAQFPDLYAQFRQCCERLKIEQPPQAYVLNGNGGLNAFATRFLGMQYVVLMSDVVDAMEKHIDGVRFYLGHELGHLRMKHLSKRLLRWPVLWLPLLGAAYSRARESTCDRHGLACSTSGEGAARALAALSTGSERWQQLDIHTYRTQTEKSSGFWMSFHELIAGYRWLTKRAARVMNPKAPMPSRNPFAYLLAVFVPYAGRLGGGFGLLIMVYIIAVMAAIAIPAYQDYVARAQFSLSFAASGNARAVLAEHYESTGDIPASLEAVGIATVLDDGSELVLDSENMVLTVVTEFGEIVFVPVLDDGRIVWQCTNGEGTSPARLPAACRGD
jgi:Zn-dependent protease with chaperone function